MGFDYFLSEALQIDVFWIDYWLVFLLWSLFLPLLLYQLGRLIRPGRNFRLLLAFLPALFYPLQVFGAITLPVSLGFCFLFLLYMDGYIITKSQHEEFWYLIYHYPF